MANSLLVLPFICAFLVLPAHSVPSVRSPVHQCCHGQRFRFSWCWGDTLPYFYTDSKGILRGFVPDVLDLLSRETGLEIDFYLSPVHVNRTTGEPTTALTPENWGADFILFELGKNDAFFGLQTFYSRFYNASEDVLQAFNRDLGSFSRRWPGLVSLPFLSSRYAGLIRTSQAMSAHWRLFDPFEAEVWVSIVATLSIFALAIVILETLTRSERSDTRMTKRTVLRSAVRALYHTWAALLSGEDYEWVTWPGRILRLGMLFFVILTTSTYTANLAAFFTAPGIVMHGPQDMDALRISRAFVIEAEEGVQVQPFVREVVAGYGTAPGIAGRLGPLMQDVRLATALGLELLARGEVDVFLGDAPLMGYLQQQNCGNTTIAQDVSFGKWGFVLALRVEDVELAGHFQAALQWAANLEEFQAIERKHFGSGQQCQVGVGSDLKRVTLESQMGVYVITGTLVAAAVLAGVAQKMLRRDGRAGGEGEESGDDKGGPGFVGMTEGEMLLRVMERLDRMEGALKLSARKDAKTDGEEEEVVIGGGGGGGGEGGGGRGSAVVRDQGRVEGEQGEALAPSEVEATMFEVNATVKDSYGGQHDDGGV